MFYGIIVVYESERGFLFMATIAEARHLVDYGLSRDCPNVFIGGGNWSGFSTVIKGDIVCLIPNDDDGCTFGDVFDLLDYFNPDNALYMEYKGHMFPVNIYSENNCIYIDMVCRTVSELVSYLQYMEKGTEIRVQYGDESYTGLGLHHENKMVLLEPIQGVTCTGYLLQQLSNMPRKELVFIRRYNSRLPFSVRFEGNVLTLYVSCNCKDCTIADKTYIPEKTAYKVKCRDYETGTYYSFMMYAEDASGMIVGEDVILLIRGSNILSVATLYITEELTF